MRLDDPLLDQARREAAKRGTTLTALIAEGLRLVLANGHVPHHRERVVLPVSKMGGGLQPGVDLNDSAALLDILEGRS